MSECNQFQCSFNVMGEGCKSCETCNAKPYEINDSCDTCWNCQSDEGLLRWDNGENEDKEKEVEIKPIEVKTTHQSYIN